MPEIISRNHGQKIIIPVTEAGGEILSCNFAWIDALQGGVIDRTSIPPSSPSEGDLYILTGTPSGVWSNRNANDLALFYNSSWIFLTPPSGKAGLRIWVQDESNIYTWDGSLWSSSVDSGITSVFQDANPRLGGNLDTNTFKIDDIKIDSMRFSQGITTTASGTTGVFAQGHYVTATGNFGSFAQGYYVTSSGANGSFAQGNRASATSDNGSFAQGLNVTATGSNGCFAQGGGNYGWNTTASGDSGSFAQGRATKSLGDFGSFAQGFGATATGYQGSFAQGNNTTSKGNNGSFAQGAAATSIGNQGCFAQGYNVTASGDDGCFAMGSAVTATAAGSWAVGAGAVATAAGAMQFGAGTNSQANTLRLGTGPRLGSTAPTANSILTTDANDIIVSSGKYIDLIPVAAGNVAKTGTANKIKGATVAKTSTGLYTITLDTTQADANYVVTLSTSDDTSRNHKVYVTNKTTTTFQVQTADDDNSSTEDILTDHPFDFVVLNWL